MSNLFKSKLLVGVMILVVMFGAFAAFAPKADAQTACTITTTLRVGSRGAEVKCLQAALGLSADGVFGPKTKAAVVAWQASKGLVADGVFGAKSRAAWMGMSTGLPAGCTSNTGYSATTGMPCNTGSTGGTLPAGCTSTAGYSPINGQKCDSTAAPQTGPVSVSLAANNPAAGTLVAGQATANLANFTFSGNGVVTGITLKRIGVSSDTTLSNVYLFDGAMRLTDSSSVGGSTSTVSFSNPAGLFTVSGSKTISVKSDIATGSQGQTVGVMLDSFTTASGTVTAGISSNVHTIASATLATVSLSGAVTPTGATLNPGANVTVWQGTLNISNRDVWMKRLALRNVGSAPASSFANLKLFVNGVQVGTATGLDSMGYVTFDLNAAPVLLQSGSRVVRVDADIVSGASRNVQFSLRQAADIDLVDSSFGVNVTPTGTPWQSAAANVIGGTSGGSVTVERDVTSPSGNTTLGGNDVVIGRYKVTAYGEAVKIETLRASFQTSDNNVDSLRNGRILINGVQYGSTATLLEDSTAPGYTSYSLNYTVMPGSPVMVELRADLYDNDGTNDLNAADTVTGLLVTGVSNAQKMDSLGTTNVPTADVAGNPLTVAAAAVTLSKNTTYANQTTVLPATGFKLGSWNLAGSSVEDVLLTTFSFDLDEANATADFDEEDVTNVYAVLKSSTGTTIWTSSPIATLSADGQDNNFSLNYTLAKNSNVMIELYGNLSDTNTPSAVDTSDAIQTDLTVTGTALTSGTGVTATSADTVGQVIAYGAASVTATTDASTPVASIVYDNQTVTSAAFKFDAVTSGYNVTDLTMTLADASAVQQVMLYDGATMVASMPGAATVTFSGLNWNVPANTNKVLSVRLQLGQVGVGAGTSGASLLTTLTAFTAVNTSTGISAAGTESNPFGNAMYVYAATPTVSNVALPSTLLVAGTQTVAKFAVSSNGGTINWKKVVFTINKNIGGTDTLASATLWDADTNTQIAGTPAFTGSVEADNDTDGGLTFVADNEQQVSGTKTYVLKMTIAGTVADGNNLSVNIAQPSSYVAPDTYANVAGTAATFVWSDISAAGHGLTTTDWNNGYLVRNLPTDTQTLTK